MIVAGGFEAIAPVVVSIEDHDELNTANVCVMSAQAAMIEERIWHPVKQGSDGFEA